MRFGRRVGQSRWGCEINWLEAPRECESRPYLARSFGRWSGVERLELFQLYKARAALSGGDGQRDIPKGTALFPVPPDVDRPSVCAVDFPGTSLRLASSDAWTWANDGIQDWCARGFFRGLPWKL